MNSTNKNSTLRLKFKHLKSRINQSEYSGLIWFIVIYLLFIILGSGVIRVGHFVQYTETLSTEEYRMTGFEHKRTTKSHDDSPGTIYNKYYIEIEYEINDKVYKSNVQVSEHLYDDVVDDYLMNENIEMTQEEILGDLYYKPWNPKKISTYR